MEVHEEHTRGDTFVFGASVNGVKPSLDEDPDLYDSNDVTAR